MKRMLSYMGGKLRLSSKMLPPQRDLIIEPFAGGAGYSLCHAPQKVLLIEINPLVASVWKYLISVKSKEILALPIHFDSVDDLQICQEAKWLIGFWLGCVLTSPCRSRSTWGRECIVSVPGGVWSERLRDRIAIQVEQIRHWEILEGSYLDAPDVEAHWVVDPPYIVAGHKYPYSDIDYKELAEWCRARKGYTVVHEAEGADWLPFKEFHTVQAANGYRRKGYSVEVIWENGETT